jgi:hypothetical protein
VAVIMKQPSLTVLLVLVLVQATTSTFSTLKAQHRSLLAKLKTLIVSILFKLVASSLSIMADAGTWDEAMLMGAGEAGKGAAAAKENPLFWGVPGYMTKEECDAYVSVCDAIAGLVYGGDYQLMPMPICTLCI